MAAMTVVCECCWEMKSVVCTGMDVTPKHTNEWFKKKFTFCIINLFCKRPILDADLKKKDCSTVSHPISVVTNGLKFLLTE